jgi:cysteinyl-tRNA synthetase
LEREESVSDNDKRATFIVADELLGLELDRADIVVVSEEIQKLLDDRAQARSSKDWRRSDELRQALAELGIEVSDGPDGQSWRFS